MLRSRKFDLYLFLPMIFLLGFGIATVGSVSPENMITHLFYIAASLIFFFIFFFFDLEILFSLSPIIYVLSLLFLTLPFIVGTVTRGSVRWVPLAGFTIQPSEIVKPFLAIVASWYWTKEEFSFKRLGKFVLLSLPVLALIFLSPDLGSTLVVLSIVSGVIFVSGIRLKHVLIIALIGLLTFPLFWFSLRDYQKMRIVHFINPYSDPLGEGYNLIQAKISVGSGGFLGRGLGRGTQSHLAFLPEKHTDFAFSSFSEELGFLGSSLVIILYVFLYLRLLVIIRASRKRNLSLLVVGIFCGLVFQTIVNIGMNIGLIPIAGVTLPLISYGGSSLLATMISLGMVQGVFKESNEEKQLEIK